eukprot:1262108-Alexandrium_andersonii.AAC.1
MAAGSSASMYSWAEPHPSSEDVRLCSDAHIHSGTPSSVTEEAQVRTSALRCQWDRGGGSQKSRTSQSAVTFGLSDFTVRSRRRALG